jgi:hypothetical protein
MIKGTNYKCSDYTTFSSLLLFLLLHSQIVSSATYTQTLSIPSWCNIVQVLFLQSHPTCFGRKRPSSGVFKTGTATTGTCVIVAGKSSHLLIRHQVGVSFDLYYDARKHKIKTLNSLLYFTYGYAAIHKHRSKYSWHYSVCFRWRKEA